MISWTIFWRPVYKEVYLRICVGGRKTNQQRREKKGNLPLRKRSSTVDDTLTENMSLRPQYIQPLDVFPQPLISERHIPDHTSVNCSRWWKKLRIYVLSIANLQILYILNILWLTSSGETDAWSCYCQRKCPSTNFFKKNKQFLSLQLSDFVRNLCNDIDDREREREKKNHPSSNMLGYS